MKPNGRALFTLSVMLLAGLASVACSRSEAPVDQMVATPEVAADPAPESNEDPYLWLEEIEGAQVDAWIEEQNAITVARLSADPRFDELKRQFRAIFESDNRLPGFSEQRQYRGLIYQLHTDADYPRGQVRRTTLESYASGSPFWETLIDVDAIAAEEGRNWYVAAASFNFSPSGDRAIVSFSDGGSDAVALREFDLKSGQFTEGGFETPVRRHMVTWEDEDTLLVATPLSDDELTTSFYPRHVRRWQRGTALEDAEIVVSVDASDMVAAPTVFETAKNRRVLVGQVRNFAEIDLFAIGDSGELIELDLPLNAMSAFSGFTGVGNHATFVLQHNWTLGDETFPTGARVAVDFEQLMAQNGDPEGAVELVYAVADNESLKALIGGYTAASDAIYLNVLEDVKSRVKRAERQDDGSWTVTDVSLPGEGAAMLPMSSDPHSEDFLVRFENFLIPPSLNLLEDGESLETLQQVQANTDLSPYVTEQFFAEAEDGTRVPYFVTRARDMSLNGSAPVLMYAYGGFGIPITQSYELPYIGPTHEIWLERGGVFVVANPRGGGEYGPAWNQAAKRTTRQTVYDDLYAVAKDIIARGISSPGKFGFIGGSNGGLTAGVLPTQRPDLFGASVSLVPLLDMARFHKLLAGASWMDEYGNPEDPVEGPALLAYSPYQNVRADGQYPEIFFLTSTRDDRVHPGHARKMAKKMMDMGHPALFYEAREGGHGMAVNNEGRAFNAAMQAVYLLQKLVD